MKKITLVLAVFSAVYLNGFGQTVVDLGYDWNGTAAVAATSGTFITGGTHNQYPPPFTVYQGTENELLITGTGTDVLYKSWAGDVYKAGETYGCIQLDKKLVTNYIEVSLTTNSAGKKISAAKLNGTSLDATAGRTANFIVLFSDKVPFNVNSIIGYNSTYIFPESRNGGTGVTLTVPDGTKSFRITRKAFLNVVTESPVVYSFSETTGTIDLTGTGYGARFAYISATLSTPTFTGAGNWSDAENWGGTVPASTDEVIIDGNVNINSNVEIAGITVNAGKQLTVANGATLTAAALTLKSNAANGTATFVNNGTATITTAKVEQYLESTNRTASTGVWYYLSSPVSDAKVSVFGESDNVGDYTETTTSYSDPLAATADLAAGKGYVVKLAQINPTVIFSGTLNDGTVSVPVSRTGTTAAKRGFNLVGNPYPSYLDWDGVTKTNVQSTIWTRTYEDGEMVFKTYNANAQVGTDDETSAHIAPLQAFWVKVLDDKADISDLTLDFANAQRLHKGAGDGNLRVAQAETQGIVRLEVSNGTNKDQTVLVFNENAGNGFNSYDSEKMSNETAAVPEIYTLEGAEKLAINSLTAVPQSSEEIALGFNTGAAGSFTIQATTVSNIDSELQITLKDKTQGVDFDLTDGNAYTFTSDAASTESRFAIAFAPKVTTGISENLAGKLQAYAHNGKLFINNGKLGDKAGIFNLTGQKLYEQTLHSSFSTFNFQLIAGVYLVKVGNQTVKVVVK